jgi:hypothetical protein
MPRRTRRVIRRTGTADMLAPWRLRLKLVPDAKTLHRERRAHGRPRRGGKGPGSQEVGRPARVCP